MRIDHHERHELLKSWLLVSLAFTLVMMHGETWNTANIILTGLLALVTVGLGFIGHELAHKYVALRFNCDAEYRGNHGMLLLGLFMSIFGFLFAAPGAVHLHGRPDQRERGIIALAGPTTNIAIALLFLALVVVPSPIVRAVAGFGSIINLWLAIFNLLPFGPFDGAKVLSWSKGAFATAVLLCLVVVFLQFSMGLWA